MILKTADEWLETGWFAGIVVVDPDGWDRRNIDNSWAEKITEPEMSRRVCASTILPRVPQNKEPD